MGRPGRWAGPRTPRSSRRARVHPGARAGDQQDDRSLTRWAADCAEHVRRLVEAARPGDDRQRRVRSRGASTGRRASCPRPA
ncbi:putative immunity protein [Cellulomonas sp.]|uniref:putative immunity protein n=1 Tax=Cellulomonas sp. TaxID=40001 RepID=UPI003450FABD